MLSKSRVENLQYDIKQPLKYTDELHNTAFPFWKHVVENCEKIAPNQYFQKRPLL